jgi:hypothetical protein
MATDVFRARLHIACEPQCRKRYTREADAEFFQRPAARNGLGQTLGEFIEFVVHNFSFRLTVVCFYSIRSKPAHESYGVSAR